MKTKEEILASIKKIVCNQLGLDSDAQELDIGADIEKDFGADSLDAVEIIMSIEEEYNIEINNDEVAALRSIEAIANLTEAKLNESKKDE